jgi:hypothetical protein
MNSYVFIAAIFIGCKIHDVLLKEIIPAQAFDESEPLRASSESPYLLIP